VILTTLYFAGAKNTNSWHARKEDLQCVTSLDILIVPSYSIAIAADGECLAYGGFSLGEPVGLGNFEFIANYFGGLSLSLRRGNKGVIFKGSTHSEASTPQWATIEDSTMELLTASSGVGSLSHDKVSPAYGGATTRNQPPLHAASRSL
jgi:hypothetical protein